MTVSFTWFGYLERRDIRCRDKEHSEVLLSNTQDRKVFQNICFWYFLVHIFMGLLGSIEEHRVQITSYKDCKGSTFFKVTVVCIIAFCGYHLSEENDDRCLAF